MAWEAQHLCATRGCNIPASGLWLATRKDGSGDFVWLCAQCGMYRYGKINRRKVVLIKSITTDFRPDNSPGQVGDKPSIQRHISPKRTHANGMTDEEILEFIKLHGGLPK